MLTVIAFARDYGRDQEPTALVAAGTNVLRKIGDTLYDVVASKEWETLPGKYYRMRVKQVKPEGVICDVETFNDVGFYYEHRYYIVVKNLPTMSLLKTGDILRSIRAKDVGRAQVFGDTVAVYDYGLVAGPPEEVPLSKAIDPAADEALAEKRAKQRAAEQKYILKSQQDWAAKGDPYGQFLMGQRYLKGDGVEQDQAKARDYFEKAAAQGSQPAKAALQRLEK